MIKSSPSVGVFNISSTVDLLQNVPSKKLILLLLSNIILELIVNESKNLSITIFPPVLKIVNSISLADGISPLTTRFTWTSLGSIPSKRSNLIVKSSLCNKPERLFLITIFSSSSPYWNLSDVPLPPSKTSLPAPPLSWSFPSPPNIVSLP